MALAKFSDAFQPDVGLSKSVLLFGLGTDGGVRQLKLGILSLYDESTRHWKYQKYIHVLDARKTQR